MARNIVWNTIHPWCYDIVFTSRLVTGLFDQNSPLFVCSRELSKKRRGLLSQNLKAFQTPLENSILLGMITDQLDFYNVDQHDSSSCCFYVYNDMAILWIRDKIKSFMRVCKSCHNNMIIVVNCDRPRPLYRPFSHDLRAAILVFTNNENFCLLESVNINYHLRKSIW